MLIILWTWEYCFLVAGDLTLSLADAMDFLRKTNGLSGSDASFVETVFPYSSDQPEFWDTVDSVKEYKTTSAPELTPEEKNAIEEYFDVSFPGDDNDIMINTSKLFRSRYIPTDRAGFSWGGVYMQRINAQLNMFGYSGLSAANEFDRCFMMLRNIEYKKGDHGAITWKYRSATKEFELLHFESSNQHGYPDGLRFLFLYLSAYKAFTGTAYPLECDIYKKLC